MLTWKNNVDDDDGNGANENTTNHVCPASEKPFASSHALDDRRDARRAYRGRSKKTASLMCEIANGSKSFEKDKDLKNSMPYQRHEKKLDNPFTDRRTTD